MRGTSGPAGARDLVSEPTACAGRAQTKGDEQVCGITGWVDWQDDLTTRADVVRAMTATLTARGPDAGGIWVSPRAALGHRRLAVTDPAGGAQPMVATLPAAAAAGGGGRVVLSYSGEVYNHGELREQLRAAGHRFSTRSDTEVVLRAYLEWGAGCVHRLVGMFAFAVWDEPGQELLLARDRLGAKPLYWAQTGSGVLFGSEPKAVLANPGFTAEVDAQGLAELLLTPTLQTPGDGIFRGLHEVRPGRVVQVSRAGARESVYWRLDSREHTDDLDTTTGTVRELLGRAVAGQLAADVPVCALLSGGVDSAAVTALAVRGVARDAKVPTFSLDFRGSERDFRPDPLRPSIDAPFAHAAAAYLGTPHVEVLLDTPDLLARQLLTLSARDLPGMGDLDVALYLLCAELRGQASVALSGEAADEVFGGYPWYHDPAALETPMFPWVHGRTGRYEVLAPDLVASLRLREYLHDRYAQAVAEVPRLAGETGRDRRLREVGYLNLTRFLPALLDRTDRMSMATGLKVRLPFCDHRLVEYLWNVPWAMKCAGRQEKGLLRRAVADLLPPEIAYRRKSGFPVSASPDYQQAVRSHLRQVTADPGSPLRPLLDQRALQRVLAGPVGGWAGPGSAAWLGYLVEIDAWLRRYRVRIV
jgi:asparagine synthase (glutamine-hydrolysing)